MTEGPHSTKLPQSWDTGSDQSGAPAFRDSECLFGPLVAALFVLLVLSGNVFAARGKPSASRAEPSRDSSVVLETHQLYSKD